ncbi:MAG: HAMP domain-containing protein [Chloroflexi bacterium]|nr:HAMP domain-containing protein [Chloroflexota bacterium]
MTRLGRNRFRRLGLQRRIMLYVTAGLAVLFGVITFLGLGAIGQATQLVYQERLTTAYTTAGSLERDFAHLAGDVLETSQELLGQGTTGFGAGSASWIMGHIGRGDPYPFFDVTGIWLVDSSGRLLDQAGSPSATAVDSAAAARSIAASLHDPYAVLRAVEPVPGSVAFASVAVRLGAAGDLAAPIAVVTTVSINSANDFNPARYGRSALSPVPAGPAASSAERYHLEVVDALLGIAVLGIGPDEHPGQLSPHYAAVRALMAAGGAAAQLHEPGPHDTFAPHVMAVVPLPGSPFYVILEQPVDVALALPNQLRDQLLFTAGAGFVAALALAWITTRHVVKPTEQLTAAAERIAAGDLASPINVSAQDEVGSLAESLEAMRGRLQTAYAAIEGTNRELENRVAERTARLGQLLRQTITAQEEERRRLARELHDETAQTIAALSIALDRARDDLGQAPPATLARIGEAREIAARLLAETRRLILGLRPAVLDDLGLLAAIRWHSEEMLGDSAVEVAIEADPLLPRWPDHIEVALFRIAQEAITNVARHADAHHVTIRVTSIASTVTISVADDGRGFDVERALGSTGPDAESVGLIGMQERVRLLNGQLQIRSTEGGGTTVLVEAPVIDEEA